MRGGGDRARQPGFEHVDPGFGVEPRPRAFVEVQATDGERQRDGAPEPLLASLLSPFATPLLPPLATPLLPPLASPFLLAVLTSLVEPLLVHPALHDQLLGQV
jgi:hypothetical protein